MMAKLMNAEKSKVLLADLQVASNFWARTKGLLFKSGLDQQQGLWIHRCNSVHTFFMKFSIDCIFIDSEMNVKAIRKNLKPGRVTLPVRGASSVIEVTSGLADKLNISEGDRLYVGA